MGRLCLFYPAKGGVGTTTIAINSGIALAAELRRASALVDANLQFGDLRVFLDLALETASIVNAISEPDLDGELFKKLVVIATPRSTCCWRRTSPESADIVMERQRSDPAVLNNILNIAGASSTTRWSTWRSRSTTSICSSSTRPTSSSW